MIYLNRRTGVLTELTDVQIGNLSEFNKRDLVIPQAEAKVPEVIEQAMKAVVQEENEIIKQLQPIEQFDAESKLIVAVKKATKDKKKVIPSLNQ